jgi:hypothetical protein
VLVSRKPLLIGRMKVVVEIAVAMKVTTAVKDLILSLASPQIPWPLVHPLPS